MSKSKARVKFNLECLAKVGIQDDCHFIDLLAYSLDIDTYAFCPKHGIPTATYQQIIQRLIELLGE